MNNRSPKCITVLLLALVLYLSGCSGGGGGGGVFGGTGGDQAPPDAGAPEGPASATIVVQQQLLPRAVPDTVTQFRFTGRTPSGEIVYGPELRPRAAVTTLTEVPTTATSLLIEYLQGDTVIGIYLAQVNLVAGETFSIVDPPYLTPTLGLQLTPSAPSLAAGTRQSIQATATLADSSVLDVSSSCLWISSDPSVVTVDSKGEITAVSPGQASITASFDQVSSSVSVTVTSATLVSIEVTPGSPAVPEGFSLQMTATGLFSDNTTQDLSTQVDWSSTTPGVATIELNGLASGVTAGQTELKATFNAVTGSTVLTVSNGILETLTLTPAAPSIADGTTQQFVAMGSFTDNITRDITSSVTWSSDNNAVAGISNAAGSRGLATAAGPGNTTIRATLGAVSGQTTLTVTTATLESIEVAPTSPAIPNGLDQQMTATGFFSDSTTQNLTTQVNWTSTAPAVATIVGTGVASGTSPGQTEIRATSGAITGSTIVTVTDATLETLMVTPANPSIANGTSQQFVAMGSFTGNITRDLTSSVTWSSDDTNVAGISNAPGGKGLATAADTGSATIRATLGSVSGQTTLTVTAATLESIGVTPASPALPSGLDQQMTATGFFSDNTTQNLTTQVNWNSTAPAVATIVGTGLASGASPGQTELRATSGTITGSTILTVTNATLETLTVTPANPSIANGTTQQFVAMGSFTGNTTTQDLTSLVTWSSDDVNVAGISNAPGGKGRATAADTGSATIRATLGSVSGQTTLTVTTATLQSIGVTPASPAIPSGLDQQMTATGFFSDNTTQNLTTQVSWNSVTPTVATIVGTGLASGASPGQTEIRATSGAITGSTVLTVTDATLETLEVFPPTCLSAPQTKRRFQAYGIYSDGSRVDLSSQVVWSTSDPSVASIANGNLGPNVHGEAKVLGTSGESVNLVATLGSHTGQGTMRVGAFLYAALGSNNNVAAWVINPSNGSLTATTPAVFSAPGRPLAVAVDPTGRFVYTANDGGNNVSVWTLDPVTGNLTRNTNFNVAADSTPRGVAVHPSGRFVYVSNANSALGVSAYTADTATGDLTPTSPPSFSAPGNPSGIAVDPTGRFVYVSLRTFDSVAAFTVDPVTGNLTPTTPATFPAGDGPEAVAVDPTGRFVYVANGLETATGNSLSAFAIDQAGGGLTPLSPASFPAGTRPNSVAVDPLGRFVYAANRVSANVSAWTLDALSGALFQTTPATFTTSTSSAISVVVDPSGRFVYAGHSSNHVGVYRLDPDTGNLTAVNLGFPGAGVAGLATTP
jgi:6-phosphogluconolactonase (cycloisomerase 2 family)